MPTNKRDAVYATLLQTIEELAPDQGDKLPTERSLSNSLGCSRQTLRFALERLEREGEIWRHVGQGTFRGRRPAHLPIRETLLIDGATPPDLMRARILLEPLIAAEAARHADQGGIRHLRSCVEAGRVARDRSECEQADDAFHRAVARACANPVLIGLLTYLSGARRRVAWQKQWDRTYRRIGAEEFRTLHCDQHADVVEAIERGEPDAASKAMAEHLATINQAMRSR